MKRVLLSLLAMALLTGCGTKPYARELEATMLVQVLGMDWTENAVELTAAGDPTAGSGGTAPVLSAKGKDFEEAKANLRAAGEEYVSLTHVTQIVLGAETDLAAVLETALKEPVLSQSATVWLTQSGTAKELLERVDGGVRRLASVELNSGVEPMTVLQSRMRLEERGWVELPVLNVEEDMLTWVGMKLWLEDGRGT